MGKDKKKLPKKPFVSVCTPTFNRRPFIPMMIKCFEHQTYPKDHIEWIIIDDGTDKIEDMVSHIPQVKYFKYDEKMTLGKKRNLTNEKATGDIIVYMDDDDYYPPDRISHAVETLRQNPKALCVGSSAMFIYFKHINKTIQFGPYGPTHATAATFAFRKELLQQTRFSEDSAVAEEKNFLKQYTIPFAQLESKKTIFVVSHDQNSFDKKTLLNQGPNPNMRETDLVPSDFIKEPDILKFFIEDVEKILQSYDPGRPIHKDDVTKQLKVIQEQREEMIKDYMKKQNDYQNTMSKLMTLNPQMSEQRINELTHIIQELNIENGHLKEKVEYLESKIKQLVGELIQERKEKKLLSQNSSLLNAPPNP